MSLSLNLLLKAEDYITQFSYSLFLYIYIELLNHFIFRRIPNFLKKHQAVFASRRCLYARKCPIQTLNSSLFVWVLPGLRPVLVRPASPVFFVRYSYVLVYSCTIYAKKHEIILTIPFCSLSVNTGQI